MKFLKKDDKALLEYNESKKVKNKVKMNGWLFDFENKRFFIKKMFKDIEQYSFDDVASVNVVEQKHGETKKHTITRGIVGAAIAGPVGAIIGVAGKGKQYNKIDYAGLEIMMKDGSFKEFNVIEAPIKINDGVKIMLNNMNKVYMALTTYIKSE